MASSFSRLQLAAALIEYDNDPTDPDAPFRSAHDSAIFAPLRRNPSRSAARKSPDFLGVQLPSDAPSVSGRKTPLMGSGDGDMRSRSSMDAMKNPFAVDEGVDSDYAREGDEITESDEELEVDLSSWGLDSFISKEKEPKSARSKASTIPISESQAMRTLQRNAEDRIQRRKTGMRSLSLSAVEHFREAPQNGSTEAFADTRRRLSMGSTYNLQNLSQERLLHNRHISSHAFLELSPGKFMEPIPFPTTLQANDVGTSYTKSTPPTGGSREGAHSSASMRQGEQNTFAIRPPSPGHASRFDPKVARPRSLSADSKGLLNDDNPFVPKPPSVMSKFDPKAAMHVRTYSNASLRSGLPLDDDGGSVMTGYTRDRPYSILDLLRPKVLVMPSPLQELKSPPPPIAPPREGFQISMDGRPLPPSARSARRSSAFDPSLAAPAASNLLTPNPRTSLTLSQLTFRNSLMVDGQRDVSYADLDRELPRAVEEGEQARPSSPTPQHDDIPTLPAPVGDTGPKRPVGKLFGKSLIDDLEQRKAQMRSKQRFFTGDDRPSMMARGSTLIDPSSLQPRPSPSGSQDLVRRNSAGLKPLISFDQAQLSSAIDARTQKGRSVFGADPIWEREMEKLQEIEAREQREAEEKEKREALGESKQKKQAKGKKQAKEKANPPISEITEEIQVRTPSPPPVEPTISIQPSARSCMQNVRKGPPPVIDDDAESEESATEATGIRLVGTTKVAKWDSSDEEDVGPRRTTGTGPRYPNRAQTLQQPPAEDSDEDVPLTATLAKVARRAGRSRPVDADSDDEPLSVLLSKTKLNAASPKMRPLSSPSGRGSSSLRNDDDDDDDRPLGLRMSVAPSQAFSAVNDGDDDNIPLAFHPAQQRRTQYNMFAQQQMMMQAQMQNTMFFGSTPSLPGPGFLGAPMGNPMLMMPTAPVPIPSPPPLHDAGKYVQVNQWRHNVAVEGQR